MVTMREITVIDLTTDGEARVITQMLTRDTDTELAHRFHWEYNLRPTITQTDRYTPPLDSVPRDELDEEDYNYAVNDTVSDEESIVTDDDDDEIEETVNKENLPMNNMTNLQQDTDNNGNVRNLIDDSQLDIIR